MIVIFLSLHLSFCYYYHQITVIIIPSSYFYCNYHITITIIIIELKVCTKPYFVLNFNNNVSVLLRIKALNKMHCQLSKVHITIIEVPHFLIDLISRKIFVVFIEIISLLTIVLCAVFFYLIILRILLDTFSNPIFYEFPIF